MNLGTAHVIRANSRNLPLADNSVDLCLTSPPYFALRSYQDGGAHYSGQIGDEPTPAEFVDSLLEVTRECVRVLKPSGSLWVNLGDKYAGSVIGGQTTLGLGKQRAGVDALNRIGATSDTRTTGDFGGIKAKSLIGIPWRYALRCIDDLGLILRAEVIWSKPNGLPESVTDRVRRSHETWFHFVLQPRYFSAVDEIREAHQPPTSGRNPNGARGDHYRVGRDGLMTNGIGAHPTGVDGHLGFNPLGKLPGSVWQVPTEPLRVPDHLGVDHFAAFPTEWPRRIIEGWSPAGVCTACGEGRRPVAERDEIDPRFLASNARRPEVHELNGRAVSSKSILRTGLQAGRSPGTRITGYACACPEPTAPTTPALILDPFGGTGTTALVAKALGRNAVSIDMSADYCRLAEWRTNDRDQLAKVLGIEKADPVAHDEQSLLDLLDGGAA